MSQTHAPKGWKMTTFSDEDYFVDMIGGSTPSRKNPAFYGGQIPWVRLGDMKKKYISETNEYLSNQGLKKLGDKLIPKNSVILSTRATIGAVAIAGTDLCTNQGFKSIVCNQKKILPEFLFYYLKSIRTFLISKGKSTTFPEVNKTTLLTIKIPIPPIDFQKKIIQKLDYILGKLEEKKKQIFPLIEQNKENIGFFEKNWISYVIDKEIEKHPKRKEWEVVKLKDISELITKGSSPIWQGISYVDHGILFITSQNVGNGRLILQKKKYVEKKFNEIQKHSILKKGDLLTNIVGAGIGRSTLFDLDEPANINQAVALIRLNDNVEKKFMLHVLNSTQIIKFMHGNKVESARPNLSLAQVRNFPVPLPSVGVQKQIVQNIKNAEEKFKSQKTQFENIKQNYESSIKYINHIQSSILDSAFLGKLVN